MRQPYRMSPQIKVRGGFQIICSLVTNASFLYSLNRSFGSTIWKINRRDATKEDILNCISTSESDGHSLAKCITDLKTTKMWLVRRHD